MFEGSETPLNLYVEICILQILMPPNLNFRYQQTVYIIRALKDPYGGFQNPNFPELQQKNVATGENCPYVLYAGLYSCLVSSLGADPFIVVFSHVVVS